MESIFLNSDYIVVEYIDLIKSPYLSLLSLIRKNPKLSEILNIDEIQYMDSQSLYEWYINRKHQNFFLDLNLFPDRVSESTLNQLLDDQISLSHLFYANTELLPLGGALKFMKTQGICKEIIIYHPHKNTFAKDDLKSLIKEDFTWMSDWDEVMKKAGSNSTYFISDIRKIDRMKKAGVLAFSSVTLPQEYRYNKKNMQEFDLDLNALMSEHPFKLTYMLACRYSEEENNYGIPS